jgi:hypothetical protein
MRTSGTALSWSKTKEKSPGIVSAEKGTCPERNAKQVYFNTKKICLEGMSRPFLLT